MSDSLRDQLLGAGFKESAKAKKTAQKNNKTHGKSKNRPHSNKNSAAKQHSAKADAEKTKANNEEIARRKKIKAEIKAIIEAEKIEKYAGEIKHSYLVGKRIKELFVTEEVRKKLISGDVVITRLNGTTYLVPAPIGDKVQSLNPDWVVFKPGEESTNHDESNDEYADFQVPDDLQW